MKRHMIFTSALLVLAFSGAAGASELGYIPSLPAPAMPVVPMISRLPSRIDTIIPGQLPTRSLPAYSTSLPGLKAPSVSLPGPVAPRPASLPGSIAKQGVSLPAVVVAKGRLRVGAGRIQASDALNELFDNAGASKQPAVQEDDFEEITAVKGDSSHLTLPESDLEREIGIR